MEKIDGVVVATLHKEFKSMKFSDLCHLCNNGDGRGVVVDIKSHFLPAVRSGGAGQYPVIYKCL